ncbi:phthiocerol synthesis polyketide synthase type I PpsC [Variibacter gotjawalensis]|uniref:Phthiocerol synthesis polyketide synthase type I PpsC n=1 Tax=Variibacter gotjawalensis TaxID=1333996 RepID=A0A0S3PNJ5_9BRAD|nr:NADPH:quinone oxidoreductase family protein [Variibacter gotjawalensis]NIK47795.1 NADPH2:quinone reductase [Variibacter gotjawalensis]RZS49682.1 NADPH2:quinone reductase [Variibacter gotjawalensis]BAT57511.1 phthiocerol synthesis polyketide synthase type I PpsC [Variibacter gotjawalensis]
MPRAVVCQELSSDHTAIEDVPSRPLARGEYRIAVHAAGLNYPDVLMLRGGYQFKPELPFTPGMEGAGVVTEAGSDAGGRYKVGDRVVIGVRNGAFAEEAIVEADRMMPLPDTFSFEEGASFRVAATTAIHALRDRAALQAGETLLVHGAGGGVGLAAVEFGKLSGARVIACASSEEKLAAAKQKGADDLVLYDREPFRDAVKRLTDQNGADVIFDPVGGKVLEESLRCMAWGCRVLIVGFTGGYGLVRSNLLLIKNATMLGVRAGETLRRDPAKVAEREETLLDLMRKGHMRPLISQTVPLEQFRDAFATLDERRAIGRVVLTMR